MNNPAPIFLLLGAPAVGKSTTSRALAQRFTKSLHIPVDELRQFVVSGLVEPSLEWNEELKQQISLARDNATQMALRYQASGFAVTIDDFYTDAAIDYAQLFQHDVHKIILYPNKSEAHNRNLKRSGGDPNIDNGIRIVYSQLDQDMQDLMAQGDWIILDTTNLSVEETANKILELTTQP